MSFGRSLGRPCIPDSRAELFRGRLRFRIVGMDGYTLQDTGWDIGYRITSLALVIPNWVEYWIQICSGGYAQYTIQWHTRSIEGSSQGRIHHANKVQARWIFASCRVRQSPYSSVLCIPDCRSQSELNGAGADGIAPSPKFDGGMARSMNGHEDRRRPTVRTSVC